MTTSRTSVALPGQVLGPASVNDVGTGTHVNDNHLYASIAGRVESIASTPKSSMQPIISINRSTGPLLPEVGTVILGKITRTTPRQAAISILALGSTGFSVLKESLPGLIRQQDIRATEIDKVKVDESFRVGDVVRAVVISLGDERSYYLSTAKNELGVVMALSEWGNQMVPVSWKEFLDEKMGVREARKVAKPV
ncbi:exosome 3'-_5 exonuclease subunit ski4 (Csl4) [Vermiconidia calcicola]|uniref:Exosome 3'->5 exonuclease subunit ski4 (Csl4) n=1 Tax=Vermiconidia calcicola TaxID=1690605 RepID=A0ACC3MIA1_9PEZI|nr:exosome 3'->5 exonuclease subunit ski4 (Csl4) [Vermiconidia calcicola]